MREFLLVVTAAVVVAGGVRVVRLRGDEHVVALRRAVVGETVYLAGMLGFLAHHADWLPWPQLIIFGCMSVLGVLLLRVLLIATTGAGPLLRPMPRRAPTPVLAACCLAGLTLVIVIPVILTEPSPPSVSTTDAAARRFGGRIDKVMTLEAKSTAPKGDRVPVAQYSVDGTRLSLVVAHHLQCTPYAVALSDDGRGAVSVTVVAVPAPKAGEFFKDGRCAPGGPFTRRTVVKVTTTGAVSTVSDTGAGGPASRVS
ncbi:hypothetical protein [Actinoplanes sp. NPDC089786]|uniref:hypothetical protein n=1 Tax=Actinoplanes sp. NPDC089786 TaxID=3155185 RepID=UPI003432353C